MSQKKYASLSTLQTFLDNLKTTFSSLGHKHTVSDLTDYKVDTALSSTSTNPVQNKVLNEEFDEIAVSMRALDLALDGKANSSHDHNSLYYTQTQIDTKLQSKSDSNHNHNDLYDTKSAVNTKIDTHNTSTTAHNDIRDLISGLTTRLNTLANSDDTTLDQLSEIVAYIKNNRSLIDGVTTSKVNVADIIDNLTTNITNKPLSAAQGVAIKALIDDLQEELDNIPQSDWNQNDSTKLDYIKNRPFYETDPVETLIVNGTIPANGHMAVTVSMQSLELGRNYTVVFDGVTYDNLICEIVDGLPAIGSSDFLFGIQSGTAMGFANDDSVSHTIKVIGYTKSIVPLERKYIAEYIDSFAGEKVEGKSYVINEESVTAAVGAEVFNDYETNIASGRYSHAEGKSNIASGMLSHAEGYEVEVSGGYSHGEGRNTIASGSESHAEGYHSRAKGEVSHAEGFGTEASGDHSHSEGDNAFAKGYASHAEGRGTEVSGNHSHVEGWCTIASGENQHVQGKFNIEDASNAYAHIVGNGSGTNSRSNAHTIDWDGNAWFAGNVYVGGTSQSEGSLLVKESDLNWSLIYDSGEISAIANSISNINVSGYKKFRVAVRCYNDGDSYGNRNGSAIFKAENGKTYQFPVWSNMFSKSISAVHAMAQFEVVDEWLVCPCASSITSDSVDIFDATEGGTAGNLVPTGSGILKCTSPLSTLTISNLDQNSRYYFGAYSRVMVWGCK
mgnify:CR=1 FL=1